MAVSLRSVVDWHPSSTGSRQAYDDDVAAGVVVFVVAATQNPQFYSS